jgi:hypothetical protein
MKKILLSSSLLTVVFILANNSLRAQAISSEQIKAQMVNDWQRAKAYTIDYLNTMPSDKYSFHPVDSIKRSFAQQMLHLASGNIFLMSKATDATTPAFFGFDIEHSAGAQSKDSVVYYVTASYDYCINAVQSSDVNKWGEALDLFGTIPFLNGGLFECLDPDTGRTPETLVEGFSDHADNPLHVPNMLFFGGPAGAVEWTVLFRSWLPESVGLEPRPAW